MREAIDVSQQLSNEDVANCLPRLMIRHPLETPKEKVSICTSTNNVNDSSNAATASPIAMLAQTFLPAARLEGQMMASL